MIPPFMTPMRKRGESEAEYSRRWVEAHREYREAHRTPAWVLISVQLAALGGLILCAFLVNLALKG